ncbi:MAG: hypothetical protein U0401_26790 [Anaerolineae bacterium]
MKKQTFLVLAAYFLLTILMTWPTVLHLSDGIPGDGFDGWQNYWNMWWVKKALLELRTSPYFTDYLYPPSGASLLFHTLNIFNSLWTLPLQLNFGLAIAYNSVVLVSFTLAGYGGYLLSLHTLTRLKFPASPGLRPAAFVGGLIFTMSPFHMAHLLGHMQVFSMIWPPFYVLWLLRTLTPLRLCPLSAPAPPLKGEGGLTGGEIFPFPGRRGVGGEVVLTSLFLILATLVDWYHTLYLLLFTGLALLWTFNVQRSTLRPLWLVLAIGLIFGLVVSPLLIPMLRAARTTPELQTGLEQSITLSADLLAFALPSEMHPLWGRWAASIAQNFSTTLSERLIFAGFTPLTLAILAIIRHWRQRLIQFWTLCATAFFILALGPYLHLSGNIIKLGDWPIPMPYLLLYHTIPFIGLTRSLSRYDLMVMLALGVLAAIGVRVASSTVAEETGSPPPAPRLPLPASRLLPFLAALLICFEFLAVPYPISKIDTPPFYFDLAAQPGDFTIAELPMNWDRPTPMLYQTVHGKRLLTAYTSRDNPLELAWRTPVLQHWRYLGPDIIDQPLDQIAPTIFYDFNLRYIVLDYWQIPPGPERAATERWLAAALPGAAPIYDDGRLKVYQTPAKTDTQPYLSLGNGWSQRQERAEGTVARSVSPERPADLWLHHPPPQPLTLEISGTAPHPQTVLLMNGDQPITRFTLQPDSLPQAITLPAFAAERIKLQLMIENQDGTPVTISRLSLNSGE